MIDELPTKTREQKMKDAMVAMSNLHEVLVTVCECALFLSLRKKREGV
jgi:hypothetical protein